MKVLSYSISLFTTGRREWNINTKSNRSSGRPDLGWTKEYFIWKNCIPVDFISGFWPREIPTGRHQRRRRFCKSRQTRVLVSTPLRRPNGQIWLPLNFSNYLAYQLQLLRGDTALSSWPRYAAVGAGWRSVSNIIWNGRVKEDRLLAKLRVLHRTAWLFNVNLSGSYFFIIIINDEFMVSGEKGGQTWRSHVTWLLSQSGGGIARSGAEQHKEVHPLAYLPQVGLLDLPSARA